MVTIDSEKCIGCLRCVAVCPFLALETIDGKPASREGGLCIKCLHCAATCPTDAIRLADFPDLPAVLTEEPPKLPAGFDRLLEGYLLSRRSYRHFSEEPVPKETLEQALRVAAWAPSAKNQHPTRWIVISDEKTRTEIMQQILAFVRETGLNPEILQLYELGLNVVMGNAKTLLLAYAKTTAINPPVDSALALNTAELMLQAKGLGTCWAGYLTRMCNNAPALRELLKLPDECQVYGALMIGYPENEEYIHIPNRHKQPEIHWL